jgi:hypothetical protein
MNLGRRHQSTAAARESSTPPTRSPFPADAHALIFEAAASVMTSAGRRRRPWKLLFERRSPLRIEPLMGWTEDDDPLAQVELSFPSADAAVAYARRQGLDYTVLGPSVHELHVVPGIRADRRTGPECPSPGARQIGAAGSAAPAAERDRKLAA